MTGSADALARPAAGPSGSKLWIYVVSALALIGWYLLLFGGGAGSVGGALQSAAPATLASEGKVSNVREVMGNANVEVHAETEVEGPSEDHGGISEVPHDLPKEARSKPKLTADGRLPKPPYRPRRYIYLDMGSNWANTLRLHMDIAPREFVDEVWEVYSFEANPFIQKYVDHFVGWLNGEEEKPPITVPPAGSNNHLALFAAKYGCDTPMVTIPERKKMGFCMYNRFKYAIKALTTNESLASKELLASRMSEAATPAKRKTRYTFVPAAVGAAVSSFPMSEQGAKEIIIRGARPGRTTGRNFKIPVVNVVEWLVENFHENDY